MARYIQDRTVIEDTESSIDLIAAGWRLHNYPDRLAVSATPADLGVLVIQRRRWANGGLIILPKLLRYLVSRPRRVAKLAEPSSSSSSYWIMGAAFDLAAGRWWHGAFGVVNIALLTYAVAFFIGLRHAGADPIAPLGRLRRTRRIAPST